MTNLFTKEELLQFNETLLGRGVPVEIDGIGYNKADYGACATYFNGISDAQYADLSKRLVKYCKTQLGLEKDDMKATHEYFKQIADEGDYNREDGISLNITENGTLISFRYNETFIETIKAQPKRQWDAENKNWIVPNDRVIHVLNELGAVGADIKNALAYACSHPLLDSIAIAPKTEVSTKIKEGYALIKFEYNKDIVDAVKEIPFKDRQWNADFKFWAVKENYLEDLKEKLQHVASFNIM